VLHHLEVDRRNLTSPCETTSGSAEKKRAKRQILDLQFLDSESSIRKQLGILVEIRKKKKSEIDRYVDEVARVVG